MARVFVTGAAGVIGTQLVKMLAERGHEILAADLKPIPEDFQTSVTYRQGDLNQLEFEVLEEFQPTHVFHLAASFERTTESYAFFEENFHNNVLLSHHILDLSRRLKSTVRFVFASSYLIYDSSLSHVDRQSEPVALGEQMPESPRNLTGLAKFSTEHEINFLSLFEESGLDPVAVRIFRGYGLGSRDVISRWVRALLQGQPIEVFDKSSSFDFVFCKDSARALIEIGFHEGLKGVINVGTGISTPIADVYQHLRTKFPHGVFVEKQDSQVLERSVASLDYLRAVTSWSPQYDVPTAIDEIISYESKLLGLIVDHER